VSKPIKLNDKIVKDHVPDWSYETKDKLGNKVIKQKGDRSYTPFNVPKNSRLKGLVLCQYKDKEGNKCGKYFYVRYKINGKPKYYLLGEFLLNIYGVQQAHDDLIEINKAHTDKNQKWIKDPNITKREKRTKASLDQIEESQKKTLGEVIEELCMRSFPKIDSEGTLTAKSITDRARYIIGYNWRVKHLGYHNDDEGNGRVTFKANTRTRTKAPDDWQDLFKKYPSGHRIMKSKDLNPYNHVSIYDSPLSKLVIDDLRPGHIKKYLSQYRSHSVRQDIKECFHLIWSLAVDVGYLGENPKESPSRKVTNKKPKKKQHKYFQKGFTPATLKKVCDTAKKLIDRFYFQTWLIILMAITGLRREEAVQLKKKHLAWKHEFITTMDGKKIEVFGKILLPPAVTKSEKEEFIIITHPVKVVLESILDMGNYITTGEGMNKKGDRPFEFYKSPKFPHLFATTKYDPERMFDKDYRNGDNTRLKTDKNCWKAIKKELGLEHCTSKMMRKSFVQISKDQLRGRSDKVKHLSRHLTEAVLEGAYDGSELVEIQEDAHTVSKVFSFITKKAV
jgi:integrase